MGDPKLLPLQEIAKSKLDWLATAATAVAFFKMVPWAEIAAALACVYWLIKIWHARKRR